MTNNSVKIIPHDTRLGLSIAHQMALNYRSVDFRAAIKALASLSSIRYFVSLFS